MGTYLGMVVDKVDMLVLLVHALVVDIVDAGIVVKLLLTNMHVVMLGVLIVAVGAVDSLELV